MIEKTYNIYSKGIRIYQNLNEKEFQQTWDMISKFISITDTVKQEEIFYEEIRSD